MAANLTRAEANHFIEALNERMLCACAVRRQLLELGVPGPYLECLRHQAQVDKLARQIGLEVGESREVEVQGQPYTVRRVQ